MRFPARAYGCFWRVSSRDPEGARAVVREAAEISRTLAQPSFEWIASWEESMLIRLSGDLDRADEVLERSREIGTEAGIPDAEFFHAVMRVYSLTDRADPAALPEARAMSDIAPEHYPSIYAILGLMEIATGEPERARPRLQALGESPFSPWSEHGGVPDSTLAYAAAFAAAEGALGEPSPWTRTAYEFMAPWRGQLFGNIALLGPTETYMAAIAPLAGHPDAIDDLVDTALRQCEEMQSPVLAMYARLHGACGLRTRDRTGDRDRAARLVDEAIALGDRMGAGIARAAAENFPALEVSR
jgi:hypothetical protein